MKVPSLRDHVHRHGPVPERGLRAGLLLRAPATPTRASSRRSSTCTCRSRSCSLAGFVIAGVHAIRHLRTGDPMHDVRSYVSIHISVIFGVAVLITGSIWAHASWGKWWVWDEPTLVSFLIVFLLYATYYPLRYAIEDRDRQARYASVFAITAGRLRAAQLHRGADGPVARSPARVRDRERRPAGLDAAHLPRLPGRDGAAVGLTWCASSSRRSPRRRSCRRLRRALEGEEYGAPLGLADRAAGLAARRPHSADARSAARRGRQVRRRPPTWSSSR